MFALPISPGLLAAIVFGLGILVIHFIPRFKWIAAGILLVAITPLAIPGFWFSPDKLGISDWDYYFSYHTNLRRTIVEFHQFPLWNPWICGGTAALGDPEFPVFTPTFLLELAFGVPHGLRLSIYFATAVGALGMLLLGKRLGLSVYASLLAAIGVAFSSVNLLEIVEGHPNIFSAMWIPWIFWAWLIAYRSKSERSRWIILCAIFLALTFFQGGIYLLMYTTFAFLALTILVPHRKHAFKITLIAGLIALGLSAIKLIPTALWLSQFQDQAYASSTFTLPHLDKILFGRYLHGAENVIPNQNGGWHEYGAYIGYGLAALAIVGLFKIKRRVVLTLAIAAILAILISSTGPFLKSLFDKAPFLPRSNISRVILFAVIPISLLAGFGLDVIRKLKSERSRLNSDTPGPIQGGRIWGGWKRAAGPALGVIISTIVAADLFTLASQLSYQAFVLPEVVPAPSPAPSPIVHTAFDYKTRYQGVDFTRAFTATKADYGTMTYCSVLGPKPAVRTIHDKENFGPVLTSQNLSVESVGWTPNHVTTTVNAKTDNTEVMLNTNYANGWKVNGKPARNIQDRVGEITHQGNSTVRFAYRAPGLIIGSIISTLTLLGIIVVVSGKRYRAR